MAQRKLDGEIPWPEGRLKNDPWSKGPRPECYDCDNEGKILIGYSKRGTEEMAPCPWCRVGFAVEYGYGSAVDSYTHKLYFLQGDSFWGGGGYWKKAGDPPPRKRVQERIEEAEDRALSIEENARRMAIMGRAMTAGGFTTALLDELYRDDPEGRAEHVRLAGAPEDETLDFA